MYCTTWKKTNSLYTFQPGKLLVYTTVISAKPAVLCLKFPSRNTGQRWPCLLEMVHIALQKRQVPTTKLRNHLFVGESPLAFTIYHNRIWTEDRQIDSIYGISALGCDWLKKWATLPVFFSFLTSFSIIKQLDFCKPQPKHPVVSRLWPDPNQSGTFEMREKGPASAVAQDIDNSGNELSNLSYIDLFWGNPQLEMDAIVRAGERIPFSPTIFRNLEVGEEGSSQNPIVLNKEEDKENSLSRTLLSERPAELLRLLRSRIL